MPAPRAHHWYIQASEVASEIRAIYPDFGEPLRIRAYGASFVGRPKIDGPARPAKPGVNDNALGTL